MRVFSIFLPRSARLQKKCGRMHSASSRKQTNRTKNQKVKMNSTAKRSPGSDAATDES